MATRPDPALAFAARLKLRQLALVAALDLHRSLRRAAEAIAVTQPAATRLLRDLEDALGTPLFLRHAWGMEPTVYGEAFARYARGMLTETGEARAEIDLIKDGVRGLLRVGCVTGGVPAWLVPALNAVRRERSGVRTFLLVNTSDVLVDALQAGTLDVAIGRLPATADATAFRTEALGTDPLQVVARRGHPLARRRRVQANDLDACPWILQPPGSPMRQEANAVLERLGVRLPGDLVETASIVVTMALLRDTDALSIMPAALAAHYADPGWVVPLRLPLAAGQTRYELITRNGRSLAPATEAFIAAVRAQQDGGRPPAPGADARPPSNRRRRSAGRSGRRLG